MIKVKIEGQKRLLDQLQKHVNAMNEGKVVNYVEVGYTQHYAIYVHEDLEATHAPGKVAKYLENPAREFRQQIMKRIVNQTKRTKSFVKGLLAGGLYLQRKSQKVVPVDTGALKASAFTRVV